MPKGRNLAQKYAGLARPLMFLRQYMTKPNSVGAVAPSSKRLARAMIEELRADRGPVIELGPGTGVFTRALLASGLAPSDLLLVEANFKFADHLRRQLPSVKVVEGDAAVLPDIVASENLPAVRFVISSIPFRSLSRDHAARIVTAIGQILVSGGTAVQYTYSTVPPFPPDAARRAGLVGRRCALVFANLPPAYVWRYDKHE